MAPEVMFIWMGGPLFMFFGGLAVFLLGTWPVKAGLGLKRRAGD